MKPLAYRTSILFIYKFYIYFTYERQSQCVRVPSHNTVRKGLDVCSHITTYGEDVSVVWTHEAQVTIERPYCCANARPQLETSLNHQDAKRLHPKKQHTISRERERENFLQNSELQSTFNMCVRGRGDNMCYKINGIITRSGHLMN